ncbi:MAG: TROVE domain-containing protein, partial [Gammaproteobacteria bacterium]|nr:TROVE domain-containing protein [Gammaproteobacteria bacterium]
NRIDSACALAILIAGIAEQYAVFTFSHRVVQVPPRKGMALRDAIHGSQPRGGTYLGSAVSEMNELDYDRLIVITDEQSHDRVPDPRGTGYVINVASNENGVGYYAWKHIDGFSESVVRWVQETERTVTPV